MLTIFTSHQCDLFEPVFPEAAHINQPVKKNSCELKAISALYLINFFHIASSHVVVIKYSAQFYFYLSSFQRLGKHFKEKGHGLSLKLNSCNVC